MSKGWQKILLRPTPDDTTDLRQLSTFMKAYTAHTMGEGVWGHRTLSPENQHLILITDNVL